MALQFPSPFILFRCRPTLLFVLWMSLPESPAPAAGTFSVMPSAERKNLNKYSFVIFHKCVASVTDQMKKKLFLCIIIPRSHDMRMIMLALQ